MNKLSDTSPFFVKGNFMKRAPLIIAVIIAIISSLSLNAQTNKLKPNGDTAKAVSIPDKWTIYQGENNGNIMLVRKNTGCNQFVGNKSYSVRCGIAFKFLFPTDNGLPQIAKEPALDKIEEDIFKIFQADLNSLVSVIITTSGFREYVLYTNDVNKFEKRLVTLKAKYPQYTVSSYSEKDADWNTYKSFDQ